MKNLLIFIFLLLYTGFLFAQSPATFSKVTCPIYKIPNSTVLPINYPPTVPPTQGWLYAMSNHLYWGTTQLDASIAYTATSPISISGNIIHILPDTLTAWWTKQNKGATAYSWGNHALAGYVTGTPWVGLYQNITDTTTKDATRYWVGQQGYVTGTPWVGLYWTKSDTISTLLTQTRATSTFEPKIAIGTTNQYWRGDKTWQTTPTGSQWTTSTGGKIYYISSAGTSGGVGIGTSNPTPARFKVVTSVSNNSAIWGEASNGVGYGGYFSATNGQGVAGVSTTNYGVYGTSTSSVGVRGSSITGNAIEGASISGYGGYFSGKTYVDSLKMRSKLLGTSDSVLIREGNYVKYKILSSSVTSDSVPFSRNNSRLTTWLRYGDKVNIGSSATPDSTLKVTGGVNVAQGLKVGYDAMINGVTIGRGNRSVNTNAVFGGFALPSNTTGSYNTGIGQQSLYTNTTGFANSAIGAFSMRINLSGNYNTSVGYECLRNNESGNTNSAFGYGANRSNTTGYSNTAVGVSALYSNTTASNLVAIGDSALYTSSTGVNNTAVGSKALRFATGSSNTALGYQSLYGNTSGYLNTAVGINSLYTNTTGHNNIAIGDSAGYSYTTLSDRMYLGARDTTGTTSGIYFDKTSTKKWGKWLGTMVIKTLPVKSGTADSTLRPDYTHGGVLSMQAVAAAGMTDPMTTAGDMIIRDYDNITARVPIGSASGYVLKTSPVDVGTGNKIPVWGAPDWTTNGLNIYRSSKVGIGNTAPTEAIEVGTTTAGGNVKVNGSIGVGTTNMLNGITINSKSLASAAKPQFQTYSQYDDTAPGDSLGLYVSADGFVGIGNTNPQSALWVVGDVNIEGGINSQTTQPMKLGDYAANNNGTYIALDDNPANIILNASGGVGINTTNPSTALDVVGTITTDTHGTSADWYAKLSDPMTTAGDMIIRDFNNTTTRLPIGSTSGYVLKTSPIDVGTGQKKPIWSSAQTWDDAYTLQGKEGWYGFNDNTESTISFNPTDTTFTLTKVAGNINYVRNGVLCAITATKTVKLDGSAGAAGTYYIYIDDLVGTLSISIVPWTLKDTKLPVAIIKWNKNAPAGIKYKMEDERHGGSIANGGLWPRGLHYWAHSNIGTRFQSGGLISGTTIGGTTTAQNQFAISSSEIDDEDLNILIAGKGKPGASAVSNNWFIYQRTNATTWTWDTCATPYPYNGATAGVSTYIMYDNGSGTMTAAVNNRWVNSYLAFTNIVGNSGAKDSARFVIIPGRGSYTSAALAQAEDPKTWDWTGFNIAETVIMYRLTWNTSGVASSVLGRVNLNNAPQTITQTISTTTVPTAANQWTTIGNDILNTNSGYVGINVNQPQTHLSIGVDKATTEYGLNIVQKDWNKIRTTNVGAATDTSSVNISFTNGGKPLLDMKNNTGGSVFKIDSLANPTGTMVDKLVLKSEIVKQMWIGVDTTAINTSDVYFMGYSDGMVIDSLIFSQRRVAGSPDVTAKVWYGVNMNSAGTAVVTAGNQITAYSTITKTGTINNATVSKGLNVWLTFSAVSVKPKGFFVTIKGHRL